MNGLLSGADVASMRETALGVMPDTCTILEETRTSAGGNSKRTWVPAEEDVPCGFAPVGGGEGGRSGEQVADGNTDVFTLPAETVITTTNRISFGGADYNVTRVRARGSWEIVRRVEVARVPGP